MRRATDVGLDDVLLMCSTILAVVQSGIILNACSYGLGRSAAVNQTGQEVIAEKVRDEPTVLSRMSSSGASTCLWWWLTSKLPALLRQHCAMDPVRGYIQGKHSWLAATTRRHEGAEDHLSRNAGICHDLGHGILICSHVAV